MFIVISPDPSLGLAHSMYSIFVLKVTTAWMGLEGIVLSEISEVKANTA